MQLGCQQGGLLTQEISGLRWRNCQQSLAPLTRSDSLTDWASHLQMTSCFQVADAVCVYRDASSFREKREGKMKSQNFLGAGDGRGVFLCLQPDCVCTVSVAVPDLQNLVQCLWDQWDQDAHPVLKCFLAERSLKLASIQNCHVWQCKFTPLRTVCSSDADVTSVAGMQGEDWVCHRWTFRCFTVKMDGC